MQLRVLWCIALCAVAALPPPSVYAQTTAEKGMVWSVPDGEARAIQDLREMKDAGVEAVRTGLFHDDELLELADTLGLNLYLDLPLARLPARRLLDTLGYARTVLDSALALAETHPSVTAVGLARYSDTSDMTACGYFEVLTDMVQRRAPHLQTYYLTRFTEHDVCGSSVDLVLADVSGSRDPVGSLEELAAGQPSATVGVGAFGTWVRRDTLAGLRVPGSPQQQARYFERHLPALLTGTPAVSPAVVFVYRWRDARTPFVNTAENLDRPQSQPYGLHGFDGRTRPAFRVVSGIYTGEQRVFAFERGEEPPASASWITLLGWAVIVALAVFYALSPRFRHMVPRYFQAHFFFREAVREGRDVLFGISILLLGALGTACGLVWHVVIEAVRTTDAFVLAVQWMPPATQTFVASIIARPLVFVVLLACVYIIGQLVWTFILSALSRKKYKVAPSQVLMLVLWPKWPLFLVMVAAMVAATLEMPNLYPIAGIAGAWMLFSGLAVIRTIIDLVSVTRMPIWMVLPAVVLSPGAAVAAFAATLAVTYGPEVDFLMHAALRV